MNALGRSVRLCATRTVLRQFPISMQSSASVNNITSADAFSWLVNGVTIEVYGQDARGTSVAI